MPRKSKINLHGIDRAFDAVDKKLKAFKQVAGRSEKQAVDEKLRRLQELRAQVSGVSYDEEAAHMMRYQRAYEANARYFQTIIDAMDALMEMVR